MGATFPRLKNWITEILSNTDLNAEIDNILNNLGPAGVDDYSTNAAQMKLQTSPGSVGSESLATSLAGELERLRYVIQRIIGSGVTYWYQAPSSSITDLVAAIGSGLPPNRIVSGATRSGSSQMLALIPNGTASGITLSASSTPFIYYIGGQQYTITADVTLSGLGTASATNNTCRISDVDTTSSKQYAKFWGQYGTIINVDGMGSNISNLTGTIAAFKYGAEYFVAYVNSTTQLTNAWRGCFFNQSAAAIPAVGLDFNQTISLMRLAWLFATTTGSIAVTYNNPTVSGATPNSPATGDYWFDLSSTAWKTYNSVTWVTANATLIGMSVQDTANCVAARTFDSYKAQSDLNTIHLERISNTVVRAKEQNGELCVFGTTNRFGNSKPAWDITQHLDSGVTETLDRTYYLYMKESGAPVISDVAPTHRRDLQGLYYPTNTWRCLGSVYNDSSANFVTPVRSFRPNAEPLLQMGNLGAYVNTTFSLSNNAHTDVYPDLFMESYSNPGVNFSAYVGGVNTWGSITTLTLTQGLWKLTGYVAVWDSTTPTLTHVFVGFGDTDGNAAPIRQYVTGMLYSVNQPQDTIWANTYFVQINNASQAMYLKARSDVAGANMKIDSYYMLAERVDKLSGVPV